MTIQTPDHHGSHQHLLGKPEQTSKGHVDAIVVPTVRNPVHLEDAASLASELRCPLVTLHSGKWTSAGDAADRLPGGVHLIAIDVPDRRALKLPDFKTSRLLAEHPKRLVRPADTSVKRNLALLLSRLAGWRRIVFLDDDIAVSDDADASVSGPDCLRSAAGLLGTYSAVGMHIGGFPDNSVVCHAYREVGGGQDSFIGGGALAVEVSRNHSFFPDIYNEDWFYMLDAKKGLLRQLAVTGKVKQREYDPFRNADRARVEEFGDTLAEGVFWLLDQKRTMAEANQKHWTDFLARRKRFIDDILDRLRALPVVTDEKAAAIAAGRDPRDRRDRRDRREPMTAGKKSRMIGALKAARGRSELITPELCQEYLQRLAYDQEKWRRHIERLKPLPTIEDALDALTKPDRERLTWHVRGAPAPVPPVPPVPEPPRVAREPVPVPN